MESSCESVDSVSKESVSLCRDSAISLVDYRLDHYLEIKPEASPADLELAQYAQDYGVAWTAMMDGKVIGCAGLALQTGNSAMLWTALTPEFKTMPRKLLTLVREKFLEARAAFPDLQLLYCAVDPDDKKAISFARHLGFKMTKYLMEFEKKD